jgi:hypothetical protein
MRTKEVLLTKWIHLNNINSYHFLFFLDFSFTMSNVAEETSVLQAIFSTEETNVIIKMSITRTINIKYVRKKNNDKDHEIIIKMLTIIIKK